MTIHYSRVTCLPTYRSSGRKKHSPSSNSDLDVSNFLPWRAFQQIPYCRDLRDVDHFKRVLLQCWVWLARMQ